MVGEEGEGSVFVDQGEGRARLGFDETRRVLRKGEREGGSEWELTKEVERREW